MDRTFIIAEIGINHNGSVDIAKRLIEVAILAGANAVKFQKRTVDKVYSEEELAKPRTSPFGETNGDLKRALELCEADYIQIDEYCRKKQIAWFASPWDLDSVLFLKSFDVPYYKVASPMLTDSLLLKEIKSAHKPILASVGMSEKFEIDRAVAALGDVDLTLMACVSTYPCPLKDVNLNRIPMLKSIYPWCKVGYSGHETGIYTTLCAVAMGATTIERHITLDRSMWGSDQAASVEPGGFIKLVKEIRDFEIARGDGRLVRLESETPSWHKLRRVGVI